MTEDGFSKLDELKRRFEQDAGSRVFLQLAEEYRKANRFEESVQVCLAGLERHPDYATARVTLARCYLALNRKSEARAEFEKVLASVPDNLLANRNLGDLYFDEGRAGEALERYRVVQMLSPMDDTVEDRVRRLESKAEVDEVSHSLPGMAAPPAGLGGDDMSAFMDLKIDESVILNADMIASALSRPPPVASESATTDEFGDFSAPTMVMKTADLAHIPGVADTPAPVAPSRPQAPSSVSIAEATRADGLSSFAARSAQKFGLGTYAPTTSPSVAPPSVAPPSVAPPSVAPPSVAPPSATFGRPSAVASAPAEPMFDDGGAGLGMDEFSEFAAPTVMLNVRDLAASGILGPSPGSAKPAEQTPSLPGPAVGAEFGEPLPSVRNPLADELLAGGGNGGLEPLADLGATAPADDLGTRAISIEDIEVARRAAAVIPADDNPFGDSGNEVPTPVTPMSPVRSSVAPESPVWSRPPGPPAPPKVVESPRLAAMTPAVSAPLPPLQAPAGAGLSPARPPMAPGHPASPPDLSGRGIPPPVGGSEPAIPSSSTRLGGGGPVAAPTAPVTRVTAPAPSGKTLGMLYLQQGHLDQALRTLEAYSAQNPSDSEVTRHIVDIRTKLRPPAAPAAAPAEAPDRKAKIAKLSNWLSSLKKG